jgi:hypothetical protein
MSDDPEPWDHTYKGDVYWLEFRANLLRLVHQEVAVSFADVEADPWFQKESHIEQAVQWDRARKRMVRGRPQAAGDVSDLVQFRIEGRGGNKWYLARRDEMHCAIAIAAYKERLGRKRLAVRDLRLQWGIKPWDDATCHQCDDRGDGLRFAYDWREFEGPLLRLTASNPTDVLTQAKVQGMGGEK